MKTDSTAHSTDIPVPHGETWKVQIDLHRDQGGRTSFFLATHPKTGQPLQSKHDCADAALSWKTHKNGTDGWRLQAAEAWHYAPGHSHIYLGIIDGERRL